MRTYPLKTMGLEEAKGMQFRLVDLIQQEFNGKEILNAGDYGIVPGLGRPAYTAKVERVLSRFFECEEAILVRGAGTGGMRMLLISLLAPGETLLVHEAPVYPTTETTIKAMGLTVVRVDLNDLQKVRAVAEETQPKLALIQHTRQRFADSYDVGQVIQAITEKAPRTIVAVDENYAAFKVPRLGCQLGADISTFSLFKLLGPEGVGCVIGRKVLIDKVRAINYSGGSQVQGPEAMEALRSLVFVPVIQAVQGEVVEEIVRRLNAGEVPGVAQACAANAEERIVLVQFTEPVAEKVLEYAWRYGAAPYPVGSESRYEVAPMFYRVSATFLTENPSLGQTTIRVNPMRAGADTVIRILNKVLAEATH